MFSKIISRKSERILFGFFLLLHLIPILWFTPFVTLDEPAHLYNAHLIHQLVMGQTSVVSHYFHINPFPEPNWTGHAIMCFITLFLPVLIAEKVWMLLIVLTSVFGFRKLICLLDEDSVWLSWLYFPFIYNFTFCLGFFNFAFALAILPWVLYWWILHRHDQLSVKRFFVGLSIATVLYFSHLVIFLLAGLFCGIITLCDFNKEKFNNLLKQLLQILLFSFPWLILAIVFVWTGGTAGYRGEITYLTHQELTEWIFNARMFVVYNYAEEKGFTQLFTYLLILITILGLVKRKTINYQFPFLVMLIFSLLLIYFLPDSMASGGILSVRIVQLFYLFWCLWIVTIKITDQLKPVIALLTVAFSLYILFSHIPTWSTLSGEAKNYIAAANVIPEESIVLPLNYSPNWLHANMCGYLGAMKRVVVLDNYEATTKHFPVLWNDGMFPEKILGTYSSSTKPCVYIREYEKTFSVKIDYVVALKKNVAPDDSCKKAVEEQLSTLFEPLPGWQNSDIQIYKRKK